MGVLGGGGVFGLGGVKGVWGVEGVLRETGNEHACLHACLDR